MSEITNLKEEIAKIKKKISIEFRILALIMLNINVIFWLVQLLTIMK